MASIKEAYDNTMKEAFTGIKNFLWAIPVSIVYSPFIVNGDTTSLYGFLNIILSFFLLGYFITIARNSVKKTNTIVPGINFYEIIKNALYGIMAIAPYAIIGAIIIWGYSFVHIPDLEIWDMTFRIVVGLFAISVPITAICLLVRRMNFFEAYNLKKFFFGLWNAYLDFSFFCIMITIALSIALGVLVYIFAIFIGFDNYCWAYMVSVVMMFVITLCGNAVGQISDDIYTFIEKEEEELRAKAKIEQVMAEQYSNNNKEEK